MKEISPQHGENGRKSAILGVRGRKIFQLGCWTPGRGEECFNRGACGPVGVPVAGGPGRCVCRWAAARPRAVRASSFARRVASKPGQALPPPTGTAAWPSGPSGALHTSGARCAGVWFGVSPRCPARACRPLAWRPVPTAIPQVSCSALVRIAVEPTPNFACNSPVSLSRPEIRSLELQRLQTLLKLRPIELHAIFRFL